MKPSGVVTLLTDFGPADGYSAAMKGVLLTQSPGVVVVDISHDVPRHDIAAGAFVLASAAPYFPRGTVHVAVVDPGVGSHRSAVAVRAQSGWFIGPDNGLLWQAVGESLVDLVSIEQVPGSAQELSSTFHGRDLFAPAAAFIARGGALPDLGPSRKKLTELGVPWAKRSDRGVEGVVIYVDGFGNIITNIRRADLPTAADRVVVKVGETLIRGLVSCYSDVRPGMLCSLIGSENLLEIAVTEGDAASRLGASRGTPVVCRAIRKG